MAHHKLKTDSAVFGMVWDYSKRAELRLNDRDFRVGDTLELREYEHPHYLGRSVIARITSIVFGGSLYGIPHGYAMISFVPIRRWGWGAIQGHYRDGQFTSEAQSDGGTVAGDLRGLQGQDRDDHRHKEGGQLLDRADEEGRGTPDLQGQATGDDRLDAIRKAHPLILEAADKIGFATKLLRGFAEVAGSLAEMVSEPLQRDPSDRAGATPDRSGDEGGTGTPPEGHEPIPGGVPPLHGGGGELPGSEGVHGDPDRGHKGDDAERRCGYFGPMPDDGAGVQRDAGAAGGDGLSAQADRGDGGGSPGTAPPKQEEMTHPMGSIFQASASGLAGIYERKHQEMLKMQAELKRILAGSYSAGFACIVDNGVSFTPMNPWGRGNPTPIADLKALKDRLNRLRQDCDLTKRPPHGGEFEW